MREIDIRRNYYLGDWEIYSLVLQGWTVAEGVCSEFTEDDVRSYYGGFGRSVRFRTPFTYLSGLVEDV